MTNDLVPYQDIEKMGVAVAESGLFGVKTKNQAIALMLIAQAYGKHPAIAAMEYHIIEGKPSKKTEAMLASFLESGGTVKWMTLTDEKAEAEFSHPKGGTITLDWTTARAQKAGLIDKPYSTHKKYPRAMLRSRLLAEGIRTIYPAATGGMMTPDEAYEVSSNEISDPTKSRVEQVIDAHIEPESKNEEKVKSNVKKETTKENNKKTTKKTTDVHSLDDGAKSSPPKGHKIIIGLIDNSLQDENGKMTAVKTALIKHPETGEEVTKFSFLIEDKRYGTFDKELADQIMESVDNRRVVKIEFTERKKDNGTILNDIFSFKEAVLGEDVEV